MRAELRHISPNEFPDWQSFASAAHPEPWDEFGWFVLDIGVEGQEGTTLFEALVATPAAVPRAKSNDKQRRVLVVDSFEPEALAAALKGHVSAVNAHTWDDVVEQLRRNMYWEYEKRWS
jgi:Immunity protein 8